MKRMRKGFNHYCPSDQCVGQIGVRFESALRRAEAFYWLEPGVRGRGIASEALPLVTEWAFRDHDIVRVQLATHLENTASQGVLERSGSSERACCRRGNL